MEAFMVKGHRVFQVFQNIQDGGKMDIKVIKGLKLIQMVHIIKDNIYLIKNMEQGN